MFAVIASVGVFAVGFLAQGHPVAQLVGVAMFGFCLLAYLLTAVLNPGVETRSLEYEPDVHALLKQRLICTECEIVKTDKAT
jgi:hypothetical protein